MEPITNTFAPTLIIFFFTVDDPVLFIKQLQKRFKLKGLAPTQHHLGCDFPRDKDKTLCMDPSG